MSFICLNPLYDSFIAIIVLAFFTGTGYSLKHEETKRLLGTRESLASQLLLYTKVHSATLIFLGWFLFVQCCIWGEAGSQQKPNKLCRFLCIGLIFLFPQKNQLIHCKNKSCRLTNSKQNPGLVVKPPRVPQKLRSVLWRGGAAIFVLAGSPQDRFVSPPSFVQHSPSFMSPEDLKCALFSAFLGRGTKPHPQQWRRIWHGGANAPNKTIAVGKKASLLMKPI